MPTRRGPVAVAAGHAPDPMRATGVNIAPTATTSRMTPWPGAARSRLRPGGTRVWSTMPAMALKSVIFKASVQISDIDRNDYAEHALTVARHPSETDERMMVRLLAFALNARDDLVFGAGLSEPDAPGLLQKDLTGAIEHWIDVGLPDATSMLRACGRSARVTVYAYGPGAARWWPPLARELERAKKLAVWCVPPGASQALARFAARNMRLHCTIQEGQVWFSDVRETALIEPRVLKPAS